MSLLLLALLVLIAAGGLAAAVSFVPRLACRIGQAGAVAGSALALAAAAGVLLGGRGETCSGIWAVPGGAFLLNLDPLAAAFILPAALLALLAAIYAGGYLHGHPRPRALGAHWCFYNLLIAALLLVFTAAQGLLFLAVWELMTLASFFLIAFEHRDSQVRAAAWFYLAVAHVALLLLIAFFVFAGAHCGSQVLADFTALSSLPLLPALLCFALAACAFALKAGLFPFHVWLPDAHPAAPSHVSALMSGVVVNTGIYGLLRIFTFFPQLPPAVGTVLMLLGAASALYGIAMAIVQQDVKRILAYSTVENVGIIMLALGLYFQTARSGQPGLASLALAGGLLHCWNHTLFKGLLFLGAGSLFHATGSRDCNRMGGLLRRMPVTGGLIIGGTLAIIALPPFNGLIGEGLIYLGLLKSGIGASDWGGLLPLLLVGVLGLVGALALIAFTRLVGIALLGEARSSEAAQAHEAGASMLVPMGVLLGLCLAIGLFPAASLTLLAAPLAQLLPDAPVMLQSGLVSVTLIGRWGGGLLLGMGGLLLLLRYWLRCRSQGATATWGCGYLAPTARMTYSAAGYAELVRSHLLPAGLVPAIEATPVRGLFPGLARLRLTHVDPLLARCYLPAIEAFAGRCVRLRWLQQGRTQVYLFYVVLTCMILIAWVVLLDRCRGGG
jgi:formate hydrogenlyase subunit 3/multisubunit Na+/H+ antiporter MnhD subunit